MAIGSLFGATPEQIMMARQKEAQEQQMFRNQQIAQQGAEFGPFRGLYQAGLRFGDVGTQASMQRMFPQQMDPALQQATAVQSVLSKYANEDQTDPDVLSKIGRELLSVAPEAGFRALTLAEEQASRRETRESRKFTLEQARTKAERDEVDFYTKNPDQTGIVLQEIASQLEQNPNNPQLLGRYERIARAGTKGAIEQFEGKNKEQIDTLQNGTILPDGTTVGLTKSAQRIVRDANGNLVTGEKAAAAIRKAQEYGTELQGDRSGARSAGASGIKIGEGALNTATKLRTNIGNLQEAIDAIDRGANTGVIMSRFPDLTAASIELNNVRNRLGLDVVGSVTFGALSEKELELALATALPTNLNPKDLKDWIQRKMTAQQKLADYLEKQAAYLYNGGSVGGWLELQRQQRGGSPAPSSNQPRQESAQPRTSPTQSLPSGVTVERVQ
jgi:hypothetical protein